MMAEVILLAATTLFSVGTATAARIGMLAARVALAGSKVAKVAKNAQQLQHALNAFCNMLKTGLPARKTQT